jgi:hypothetical protein
MVTVTLVLQQQAAFAAAAAAADFEGQQCLHTKLP